MKTHAIIVGIIAALGMSSSALGEPKGPKGPKTSAPVVIDADGQLIGTALNADARFVGGHLDVWDQVWVIVEANEFEFVIPLTANRFEGRTQLGYLDTGCGADGGDPFFAADVVDQLAGGLIERGLYRDGDIYLPDREFGASNQQIRSVWSVWQGCVVVNQFALMYPTMIVADFSEFVPPFMLTVSSQLQ